MNAPTSGEEAVEPSREVEVLSNTELAPGVFSLTFPREFEFLPGQILAITVDKKMPSRYYSIASGNREAAAEILYDLVPGGALTPSMSRLGPGDRILISRPFGGFLDRAGNSWWIATGTGIAPFLSMVRSEAFHGKRLVHGGRTLDGFYYRSFLSDHLGDEYQCCCSVERADWAYPGRLTAWLRQLSAIPQNANYLLCGSAGMVVEVRDLLISKSVAYERITAEIYF